MANPANQKTEFLIKQKRNIIMDRQKAPIHLEKAGTQQKATIQLEKAGTQQKAAIQLEKAGTQQKAAIQLEKAAAQRKAPVQLEEAENEYKAYLITKRTIDIIGSLAGIAFLSLLLVIVAILIKLEDPKGKVFFSQKRIGLNGKEFKMYKFRSMVSNAEKKLEELLKHNEVSGPMFKMKDDPRITKIGRFIRKTSIDELPQLFNVLKGDMSLVGPRPPLPREVAMYSEYDMQRLSVTPGCTGLWQVSGRNSVGFEEMVELDLHYIAKRSVTFDLMIIIKTVKVVIFPNSAY